MELIKKNIFCNVLKSIKINIIYENFFKTPQPIYFYNSSNFIHNPSIFKIMKKNIRNAGRKRLFKPDVLTAEIRMIVPSATKIEIIEFINDKKKPYLWKIEL